MEMTVGIREAKNRFSYLTSRVNETGETLTVLKNGNPWVSIVPASAESMERTRRLDKLHSLTRLIESDASAEPVWDENISDKELLEQELQSRYGENR